MPASESGSRRLGPHGTGKRDRRPLRYRVGLTLRVTPNRIDVACLDGRILEIRVAERTLFVLGGLRLAGPRAVRAGVEVRIATVESSSGPVAVLVEVLSAGRAALGPKARAFGPGTGPVPRRVCP